MASLGFCLQVLGALAVAAGLGWTAWSVHGSAKAIALFERTSARILKALGQPRMADLSADIAGRATVRAAGSTRPARPAEDADLLEWVTYLECYSERVASESRGELEAAESRLIEALDARDLEVRTALEDLQGHLDREILRVRTDGLWLAMFGAVATLGGLLLAGV